MVTERTRNIFDYLCRILEDGLATIEDVRRFIGNFEDLSEGEVSFLDNALSAPFFGEQDLNGSQH